jgi:hypothetical protein
MAFSDLEVVPITWVIEPESARIQSINWFEHGPTQIQPDTLPELALATKGSATGRQTHLLTRYSHAIRIAGEYSIPRQDGIHPALNAPYIRRPEEACVVAPGGSSRLGKVESGTKRNPGLMLQDGVNTALDHHMGFGALS